MVSELRALVVNLTFFITNYFELRHWNNYSVDTNDFASWMVPVNDTITNYMVC